MNNINNQFPLTGIPSKQSTLPDFRSSAYVKEQSISSRESLDTDLVIQTKEGDRVTLTSNSFSEMDAYTYDSKGQIQTESGGASYSESIREITLSSGKSFSFSVQGDLSEEELGDIDDMLKGLDGVITDMKSGDLAGAVDSALNLGDFDSFSAYSVDISYEQSYQMTSSVAASQSQQVSGDGSPSAEMAELPSLQELEAINFDSFFNKLLEQFDNLDEKQSLFAKDPVNNLFQHHLDEMKEDDTPMASISEAVQQAMAKLDTFLEEMKLS